MKLNIGSHNKVVKGYLNVDALPLENVDHQCDITKMPWWFNPWKINNGFEVKENTVEEILMVEVLEHISWRETDKVLSECFRVLKVGGLLHIQVPDCGSMMYCFACNAIDEKIPHKGDKLTIAKLQQKHNSIVNPNRWLMAFCGAQKHKYDAHLNIFTKERMEKYLENAGFGEINFIKDPLQWKIIVKATKK